MAGAMSVRSVDGALSVQVRRVDVSSDADAASAAAAAADATALFSPSTLATPLLSDDALSASVNGAPAAVSENPVVAAASSRFTLALLCVALLVTMLANNIGLYYCSQYFGSTYAFWFNQSSTALFLLVQSPVIAWRLWGSRSITPEMRAAVSWRTYGILSALDTLTNLLTTMAAPRVTGPVQSILYQLPVPATMLLVKLRWPHTRYRNGQYLGAVIIVGGAVLSVLPGLLSPPPADSSGSSSRPDNPAGALIVFTLGVLVFALVTVFKEHVLKAAPLVDVWYLSFVENAFELLWGFALVPALWIPGVGVGESPGTTWRNFRAGGVCMLTGVSELDPSAHCAHIFVITLAWTAVNVAINVVGLAVCRAGSSVVYNIIGSVQLPLVNLLFTSSFIMTAALATKFSPTLWVAVACVFVGFVIYQFAPLQRAKEPEAEADSSTKELEEPAPFSQG